VYGSVAAFVDITERKRMEGELLKAKKLEALGILAGGIAHDFNNILTIVLGNIQIAEQGVERGTVIHQRLDNAAKAVIRAKDLATEFLTISFGGAPLKSVILLDGLIRDITGLVLSGSHVDCEYSFPNALWRVEVDYNLISRAFSNIVLNAKEAMVQGGSITIHASNTVVDSKVNNIGIPKRDGRYVKISIIDRGIGIPKKDIDKIFDPYFSTKGRNNIKGMGLGLAVAHSIIKRHQGHIHVESDAGFGTTFHIFLPASETMEG
jgi:signal transduction histidine kinase